MQRMWGRLILRSFMRIGRQNKQTGYSARWLSSQNLKEEFEEYQKRAGTEKSDPSAKKVPRTETGKTMDEIKKEAEESVRSAEERMKQDFQDMKKQKTSLEFTDILNEMKQKPKAFMQWSKTSYVRIKDQTQRIVVRTQEVKARVEKAMPKRKKTQETIPKEPSPASQKAGAETSKQESKGGRRLAFLSAWREKLLNFYHLVGMKMKTKFPKVHTVTISSAKGLVKLWRVTFPDQEGLTQAKFARVKEDAKAMQELESKMKTLSEEEALKLQATIPEHRRRALVLRMEATETDKTGIWSKLKVKIEETDSAKKLKGTSEYKQFQDLKQDITAITNTLKEAASSDASPVLNRTRDLLVVQLFDLS